jgi:transcriptional regulator with GAF, ATPase, and Fis domain
MLSYRDFQPPLNCTGKLRTAWYGMNTTMRPKSASLSTKSVGLQNLLPGGVFLDEVGELPVETQIALLRVLQEHEFERVGGTHRIRGKVRVIAPTNRDLQAAISAGSFRSDLFYRLHLFPIDIRTKGREEHPRRLEEQEKDMIEAALKESRGRIFGPKGAAAKLGIPRSTLESKIKSLKINKNRFRAIPGT